MSERKQGPDPVSTIAELLAEARAMASARYTPRSAHFRNDWAHSGAAHKQPADGGQLRRRATAQYHRRRRAAKATP